jgi:hypothetical protein
MATTLLGFAFTSSRCALSRAAPRRSDVWSMMLYLFNIPMSFQPTNSIVVNGSTPASIMFFAAERRKIVDQAAVQPSCHACFAPRRHIVNDWPAVVMEEQGDDAAGSDL